MEMGKRGGGGGFRKEMCPLSRQEHNGRYIILSSGGHKDGKKHLYCRWQNINEETA
jgi:hypothetical protein